MLFVSYSLHGQLTQGENYVQTKIYLDYNELNQPTKVSESVQYYDGLGRPKQIINVKGSPLGRDVVVSVMYDQFGRQTRDYLPVSQNETKNGGIYTQTPVLSEYPVGDPTGVYAGEKIYTEKILENSPLNRVQQQIKVGNDWIEKPVKFEYTANVHEDYVRQYKVTTSWVEGRTDTAIELYQYFLPAQLYKNIITDEDGNKSIEFKNEKGQLILSRKVLSNSENADTYFIYNEYDQVTFVIPPLAPATIDESSKEKLYYQYRYDVRGRLVEKKIPGKGWEYMAYDKANRLIMTQDANMRASGKWLFTKYDKFSRVIYTGIANIGVQFIRQQVQDSIDYYINSGKPSTEDRDTTGFNSAGMNIKYSNVAYPGDHIEKIYSVNYYDSYPNYDFNPSFPTTSYLTETINSEGKSTKGMAVMNLIKNIEDDNWTKNYTYYDLRGRVIGIHSINHLGGYTRTELKLDFAGLTQEKNTYQVRKSGEVGISVQERFVYDQGNRLKEHYHKVDNKPEQLLAKSSYNELSQLINKEVGNNLQSIDYAYNIHGWLTNINPQQMLLPDLGGKLFSYKIKYNQRDGIENPDQLLFSGKNVKARYNGSVSEVDWRAIEAIGANPSTTPKRYGYVYDSLNRLTAGYYQNPLNSNSKENTESLSYDLNGNITSLYRTSVIENLNTATVIDNLEFSYIGNHAIRIKDNSKNKSGYEGKGSPIEYDLNGNMKNMLDKRITGINYNYLNLPNSTISDMGQIVTSIDTKYNATGIKLRKEYNNTSIGIINTTWTKEVTDYLDGFQYFKKTTSGGGGETEFLSAPLESKFAYEQQAFRSESTDIARGIPNPKHPELQFLPTTEGYYDYQKEQYIYQYKDHLGNARISFGRNTVGNLEITDANDYYPYGMNHLKTGNAFFGQGSYKNYKYNGKELQENGMYDYGARMYMADIGRWSAIDPLAEKFFDFNGYNYVLNNPIKFVDKDGMDVYIIDEKGHFTLAKKQTGDDIVFGYNSQTGSLNDNNNDKKIDNSDGQTIKTKGLMGQLRYYRDGNKNDDYSLYHQAIKEYDSQVEDDMYSLFYYAARNAKDVEFSLIDFDHGNKRYISLQTYNLWGYSPGPNQIGVEKGKERKLIHNHPANDRYETKSDPYFTERYSMGENSSHGKNDYGNVYYNKITYPYHTFFPNSTNLYNVTQKGIKFIKQINNSKDLK